MSLRTLLNAIVAVVEAEDSETLLNERNKLKEMVPEFREFVEMYGWEDSPRSWEDTDCGPDECSYS